MIIRIVFSFVFLTCTLNMGHSQSTRVKTAKVKGTVVDAKGFPVHKADIFVDSLKTGYRTNKKGEYKLRIPGQSDVISIFSKVYGMQSIVYDGQEEIDFNLPENNEVITEEELTRLGYIFDTDVFQNAGKEDYSKYADIFQIIREKFTGVTVNSSTILVRGNTWGDQTPLFVVDGNYVSSIANINVDMLKSIELLKGEDTALYGARGAPGVFIITLK